MVTTYLIQYIIIPDTPNSDEAMKQLLLSLNAEQEPFIIEDLDDKHVLVDRNSIERLKERFSMALEENVYKLKDGQEVKSTW